MSAEQPIVINISPMAHLAVGFFALSLLVFLFISPCEAMLMLIPLAMSVLIVRVRRHV